MSGEPPSNVRLTDGAGHGEYRHASDVTDLTDDANGISDAIAIVRRLAERDTVDKVCAEALPALDDAQDHLDDVITALEDGRLAGGEGG